MRGVVALLAAAAIAAVMLGSSIVAKAQESSWASGLVSRPAAVRLYVPTVLP